MEHLASIMSVPFVRIQLTEAAEIERLIGKVQLRSGETFWQDGRLVTSMSWPCIACLDEWNSANGAVQFDLRGVLDGSGYLALDDDNGRLVEKHAHAFITMTGNPHWVASNTGLMPLSAPDADRTSHFVMDYADIRTAFEVAWNAAPDDVTTAQVANAVMLWKTLQNKVRADEADVNVGLRSLLNFVSALGYHTGAQSFRKVFSYAEPSEVELLLPLTEAYSWAPSGPVPEDLAEVVKSAPSKAEKRTKPKINRPVTKKAKVTKPEPEEETVPDEVTEEEVIVQAAEEAAEAVDQYLDEEIDAEVEERLWDNEVKAQQAEGDDIPFNDPFDMDDDDIDALFRDL
jgi:MoxR-like ATPase